MWEIIWQFKGSMQKSSVNDSYKDDTAQTNQGTYRDTRRTPKGASGKTDDAGPLTHGKNGEDV